MKRTVFALLTILLVVFAFRPAAWGQSPQGPIIELQIESTINPATADYLRSGLEYAAAKDSRLIILRLNTPGGLLPSMQLMVELLLQSKTPTVVWVSPQGAGAMSAGMFITLAGHFAVMAPGTTIGAAHPVLSGGQDITGDMGQKIENFSVSLAKAIAEQRGRNIKWAEEAVRESIAATDREAASEGVIDFIASDFETLLAQLEGKTAVCAGRPISLVGLREAAREVVPMSMKQKILNYLADPNIAMLLGMAALLGLGIELYHPGAIFPGVLGAVCLVLSLMAGQVLPITVGGMVLLGLGLVFCVAEVFVPSFGVLGIVGTICVAVGAFYAVDEQQIFSSSGFEVDRVSIFASAFLVATCLGTLGRMMFLTRNRKVTTGAEGLVGKEAKVVQDFREEGKVSTGKVSVMGELWRARLQKPKDRLPVRGDMVIIRELGQDMTLVVDEGD